MSEEVVVLGSGYAGTSAVQTLEDELDERANVTWISDVDYHIMLHEVHRCIRDPSFRENIVIPVEEIKSPDTRFVQGKVVDVDTDGRTVEFAGEESIDYDYLIVVLGSQTAFFGIDGLKDHAYSLKNLNDALKIHRAVDEAARKASWADPARIIIGGAGLSGIQVAGEITEFRDENGTPIEIRIIEGLDQIFPNNETSIQQRLRDELLDRNVHIHTGEFISEVDEDKILVGEDQSVEYDVLIWTGGITGLDVAESVDVKKDGRSNRLDVESTLQTDDERVFAAGDSALVDQTGENPAPPTARAAWRASTVAAENVARTIRGQSLRTWTYEDKGTVVSIGDSAVAHSVSMLPVTTFGGPVAKVLKKTIAARWIATLTGAGRAVSAWSDL